MSAPFCGNNLVRFKQRQHDTRVVKIRPFRSGSGLFELISFAVRT